MSAKTPVAYLDHLTEPDVVRYRHTIELNVAAHDSEESLRAVEDLIRNITTSEATPPAIAVHSYSHAGPIPEELEGVL